MSFDYAVKSHLKNDGFKKASAVEICECPEGYSGTSCEVKFFIKKVYLEISLL